MSAGSTLTLEFSDARLTRRLSKRNATSAKVGLHPASARDPVIPARPNGSVPNQPLGKHKACPSAWQGVKKKTYTSVLKELLLSSTGHLLQMAESSKRFIPLCKGTSLSIKQGFINPWVPLLEWLSTTGTRQAERPGAIRPGGNSARGLSRPCEASVFLRILVSLLVCRFSSCVVLNYIYIY